MNRFRALAAVLLAGALLAGCSTFSEQGRDDYRRAQGEAVYRRVSGHRDGQLEPPYDVRPLLKPASKYLGLAARGAPADMKNVDAFAKSVVRSPT